MPKTIDDWLFWAYRDQLPLLPPQWCGPDQEGNGWDKVGSWSVGGTNRYGVVHALEQRGAFDGRAILLADAVLSLDDVSIGLPDGWNPCEDFDMGALGPEGAGLAARALAQATLVDCQGERRLKRPVSDIVRRYALTGAAPEWECEPPKREALRHAANGRLRWFVRRVVAAGEDMHGHAIYREVEQDGWNAKGQRPVAGAYCKYVLTPDPVAALVERAEYEVLHAALGVLVDEWTGADACLPTRLPARPWVEGVAPARRILDNLQQAS